MFVEIFELFPHTALFGQQTVSTLQLSAVEISGSGPWLILGAILVTRAMLCFADRDQEFPEQLFEREDR